MASFLCFCSGIGSSACYARYFGPVLVGFAMIGCGREEHQGAALAGEASASLPELVAVSTINNPVTGDVGHYSRTAIGGDGTLLLYSRMSDTVFVLVSSEGQFIGSFGREGEGPGEVRQAVPVSLSDTLVTVLDRGNYRLAFWRPNGQYLSSQRLEHGGVFDVVPTPENGWLIVRAGASGLLLERLAHRGGPQSIVLSDGDFVDRWGSAEQTVTNRPAIGTWPGGLVIADPMSAELALFTMDGRLVKSVTNRSGRRLPSQEDIDKMIDEWITDGRPGQLPEIDRRRAFSSTPIPWYLSVARQDREGRTWFIGSRGDSGVATIYSDSTYLGELVFACQNIGPSWDLNATWLSVVCSPPVEDSLSDAVVRIFRIEG